jgi:hypothetical protein
MGSVDSYSIDCIEDEYIRSNIYNEDFFKFGTAGYMRLQSCDAIKLLTWASAPHNSGGLVGMGRL